MTRSLAYDRHLLLAGTHVCSRYVSPAKTLHEVREGEQLVSCALARLSDDDGLAPT
jgi:hypothetical protein